MKPRKHYKELYYHALNRRDEAKHRSDALLAELTRLRGILAIHGREVLEGLPRPATRYILESLEFECAASAIQANSVIENDALPEPYQQYSWRGVPLLKVEP